MLGINWLRNKFKGDTLDGKLSDIEYPSKVIKHAEQKADNSLIKGSKKVKKLPSPDIDSLVKPRGKRGRPLGSKKKVAKRTKKDNELS